MPIDICRSMDGYGVVIVGQGVVTDQEYLETFLRHLNRNPAERKKDLYTLVDWSGVTKVKVTSDSIRYIAGMCKLKVPQGLKLILATIATEDVVYGLSRMADVFKQNMGWETAIFRNHTDAEAWLSQKVKARYAIDSLNIQVIDQPDT